MYAYQIRNWEEHPQWVEVEKPIPGRGEILVKVAGNGLCQSDLHMPHMPESLVAPRGWQVPFTLGHEIGGWIDSWGDDVSGWEQGEPVALVSPQSCGSCHECIEGFDNVCTHGGAGRGFGKDGGLAEYVLVDSTRPLIRLSSLDPLLAGPLTDAGSTSYHAVDYVKDNLAPGAAVLVIGAGGLGSFAIQYLKLLTKAEIIVADVSDIALQRASRFGADQCIDSKTVDVAAETNKLTSGHGVQAVLDFVGTEQTITSGLTALGPRGMLVLVGAGNGGYAGPLWHALAPKAASIYSFQGPTIADTLAVMQLAEQGELENPVEIFDFNQDSIEQAFHKMESGELTGRAVIRVSE